jgi:hypothetical protein
MRIPVIVSFARRAKAALLCRETFWAAALALLLLAIAVMTADNAPTWIYQGF